MTTKIKAKPGRFAAARAALPVHLDNRARNAEAAWQAVLAARVNVARAIKSGKLTHADTRRLANVFEKYDRELVQLVQPQRKRQAA